MAERTLDLFTGWMATTPTAMPQMLVALQLERSTPRHIVIAGRPEATDTRALIREFNRHYLPSDLLLLAGEGELRRHLARLAPYAGALEAQDGKATAYVCVNYACRLPTTDPATFAAQLEGPAIEPPTKGAQR